MRDPKRIHDFMTRLEKCWQNVPDWRFCQLFCNVMRKYNLQEDPFWVEDERCIKLFEQYFKNGVVK